MIRPTSGAASLTEFPGPLGGVGNVTWRSAAKLENDCLWLHMQIGTGVFIWLLAFLCHENFLWKQKLIVSFEIGILNFQHISNQTCLTGLILPLTDTFCSLASTTLYWWSTSLTPSFRSLLLIRAPHNSFLGSLLFLTCTSSKSSFVLLILFFF